MMMRIDFLTGATFEILRMSYLNLRCLLSFVLSRFLPTSKYHPAMALISLEYFRPIFKKRFWTRLKQLYVYDSKQQKNSDVRSIPININFNHSDFHSFQLQNPRIFSNRVGTERSEPVVFDWIALKKGLNYPRLGMNLSFLWWRHHRPQAIMINNSSHCFTLALLQNQLTFRYLLTNSFSLDNFISLLLPSIFFPFSLCLCFLALYFSLFSLNFYNYTYLFFTFSFSISCILYLLFSFTFFRLPPSLKL